MMNAVQKDCQMLNGYCLRVFNWFKPRNSIGDVSSLRERTVHVRAIMSLIKSAGGAISLVR